MDCRSSAAFSQLRQAFSKSRASSCQPMRRCLFGGLFAPTILRIFVERCATCCAPFCRKRVFGWFPLGRNTEPLIRGKRSIRHNVQKYYYENYAGLPLSIAPILDRGDDPKFGRLALSQIAQAPDWCGSAFPGSSARRGLGISMCLHNYGLISRRWSASLRRRDFAAHRNRTTAHKTSDP